MIYLYNSLSKQKEALKPMVAGKLGLYVCGLTVYDKAHIGHLRCMLVFDLLVRFLQRANYQVTYVRNITDVDDKIITRAQEEGIDTQALTDKVIKEIQAQERTLGLIEPTHEPRASAYMAEMIDMINQLIDKGYAYVADSGDVCFSVEKYPEYGQLSGQDVSALIKGYRIEGEGKASPADFVLWKPSKPGEPYWPSPWGDGRPGWHIECSAMSNHLLGETFDLHGGGVDLKFPHHENEMAQSVCATGGECARHWMHVGHLHVNDEKMSKSLGNFVTVDEALVRYHPEVIKFFLLKTQYRQPFNYTEEGVIEAQTVLLNFYLAMWSFPEKPHDEKHPLWQSFMSALSDDLNVAKAISIMHQAANATVEGSEKENSAALLRAMGGVLGVLQETPAVFLQEGHDKEIIESKIQQRQRARAEKDFATADSLRAELQDMGVVTEDIPNGTRWYRKLAGLRLS